MLFVKRVCSAEHAVYLGSEHCVQWLRGQKSMYRVINASKKRFAFRCSLSRTIYMIRREKLCTVYQYTNLK